VAQKNTENVAQQPSGGFSDEPAKIGSTEHHKLITKHQKSTNMGDFP
jgi:hypothetical protein